MAAADMQIDSAMGEQWCEAVEAINQKVQQIMNEVAAILENLGDSDKGGNIGNTLKNLAGGYLQKFGEMVEKFMNVVTEVADFIGKAVEFTTKVIDTVVKIAGVVSVFL